MWIVLLKSVLVIVLNLLVAFGLVWLIKFLLILPLSEKRFRGKRVPLTPGFLIRKRNKYFTRISKYYYEFAQNCHNDDDTESLIAKWEEKAYHKFWDKFDFVDSIPLLTTNMKANIRHWLALLGYEVVKQFLRSFVPFLMNKFNTDQHMNTLEKVTSPTAIKDYYNRFIHKFLLIFFLIVSGIVGFINMIIFLILH